MEGEKEGEREIEKNELYIIHFLVKDSLGQTFLDSSAKYHNVGGGSLFV